MIQTVYLIQIDIIQTESLQGMVNLGHDILAGKAGAIGFSFPHGKMNLGGHHDLVPIQAEIPDQPAGYLLGGAVLVNIGSIKIVDPLLHSLPKNLLRTVIIFGPRKNSILLSGLSETHAPEADTGHVHP